MLYGPNLVGLCMLTVAIDSKKMLKILVWPVDPGGAIIRLSKNFLKFAIFSSDYEST